MVRTTLIIIFLSIALPLALPLASLSQELKVYAQESNPPAGKVAEPGHFIRRWLTLGPIVEGEAAPKAIETDYLLLATGIPEWQFATLEGAPKVGDMVTLALEGHEAQEQIWKILELPANWNLNLMLLEEGEVDFALVYLLTFIEAKESTRRELLIGSNDGVKVWLNGRVAHTAAVNRPLVVDQDRIIVDLKKGINCLMVKVADTTTEWQFTLRFSDESDESGLQFYDTPDRQLLSLGKQLSRLANYELPDPSKPGVSLGTGTEGIWKTYRYVDDFDTTQPKGLASNNVLSIMQDKEGAIWIGTADRGVSWFDGVSWKTYTQEDGLASNTVSAMMQDNEGNIWIGTDRGLSRFDGKSQSWKTYTHTQMDGFDTAQPKDLASNTISVRAMMQDKEGNIWIGTDRGLSQFDAKSQSWKTYTHTQMDGFDITQPKGLATIIVSSIIQDHNQEGVFWVGTWGRGIIRLDGNGSSWRAYTRKDGLADDYVASIIQDKKGNIWVGTVSNGVGRFDGKTWKTYTQKDGLANNEVRAIMQDKEGVIWFGTWGGGVSGFDGKSWKTYTKKNGLASNWVEAIMQDREGNIWFGSWDGVSRFDYKSWHTYTQKDGLATDHVRAIIQDKKGDIWFGTDGKGVSRFDGKSQSWKTYTQKDVLGDDYIDNIIQDKAGNIWVATWLGGVSRFDGVNWKTYTQKDGLASNQAYGLMQDSKGDIWVGMWRSGSIDGKPWTMWGEGVSRFNGKSWKTYTQKDGLASDDVTAIFQDKAGNIWFTTRSGDVSRFDGVNWKTYTQKDGLANNRVEAIMQDKEGAIWFGTYGGLSRFDGKSQSWKTYTQKDGLANNQVNAIAQDQEGRIWIGTNGGGLSVFDDKYFQILDSQDGLVNNNIYCIYINRGGEVWIGTEAGAVRFIPNKIPPMVRMIQITANNDNPDNPYNPYKSPKDSVLLKAGNSRVTLSYRAISFKTRPGNIKYLYKLVGRDSEFQGPTNRENVEYFNLKPGNYTFQVQAIDRDLNYSPIAQLPIVLPPLWHQLAWVRGIIGFGGLSFFLAFGLVWWRWSTSRIATRRLEAQLREQEAHQTQLQLLRYQLNPHFLFNVLNSLRALIGLDGKSAQKMVTELSEYLRYSLLNKSLSEISLRDEVEAIRNFLDIEKICFRELLEVSLDIEPEAEKYRIPSFLIQPLVENAIKYGMQTSSIPLRVKICAQIKGESLQIEVANSGTWLPAKFDKADKADKADERIHPSRRIGAGTGIGLQNVKERLKHSFPDRHQFEIFERDGWVHVVIKIELGS